MELSEEQAKPFRERITKKLCVIHPIPVDLTKEPIHAYPHEAGWPVKGLRGRWWLYIVCPKCHYQWALWKLGVPREFEP